MPTEELYEKLEEETLKTELESYKKTFISVMKDGKYGEGLNLTISMAIKERGSSINATSIQRSLVMLSKAITEGKEAVYKLFTTEFYDGLVSSDAPFTAKVMKEALEPSKSNLMNIGLAIAGVGLLALFLRK